MPQMNTTPALMAPKLYAYLWKRENIVISSTCTCKLEQLGDQIKKHVPLGRVTLHRAIKTEDPDFADLPTGKRPQDPHGEGGVDQQEEPEKQFPNLVGEP